MKQNNPVTAAVETMQPQPESLSGLVRDGLAIMRIENENQSMIAVQRPRDEEVVLRKALKGLELIPEYASRAYYVLPFKSTDEGVSKDIEGLSIRAAEDLIRLWGNASMGARFTREDEEGVHIDGVVVDYESNVRIMNPIICKRMRWSKKTQNMQMLRGDKFAVAMQADASKAMRNAVLRLLPVGLKLAYFKKAKELAAQMKSPSGKVEAIGTRIQKMLSKFSERGVLADQIFQYLKVKKDVEITEDHLGELVGIYNAIIDGEYQVSDYFKVVEKTEGAAQIVENMTNGKPAEPEPEKKKPGRPPNAAKSEPIKKPEPAKTESKSVIYNPDEPVAYNGFEGRTWGSLGTKEAMKIHLNCADDILRKKSWARIEDIRAENEKFIQEAKGTAFEGESEPKSKASPEPGRSKDFQLLEKSLNTAILKNDLEGWLERSSSTLAQILNEIERQKMRELYAEAKKSLKSKK